MQGYESVFITDPDLSDEASAEVVEKIKNIVTTQGGEVHEYHPWGRRRLAYLINNKTHGVYHLMYITGGGEMLKQLTQQYRFTEEIIRFQTIRVENIQEESERFQELYKKAAEPEKEEETEENAVAATATNDEEKGESPSTDSTEETETAEEPSTSEEPAAEESASPNNEEEK
ncbi:MAG: 30S ribosomal protein S6 [SAR324 cluster bacterium]|nr:30S ribosomal protein S6 [SAR324 cluster bacterium]